jgi:DNA-binding CsgD family transcriptional regulator
MSQRFQALTEKEKQTLRLMGRGHDAKSMARHLSLSVHTVNERLRAARRKLSVSSSREAARLLLDSESHTPHSHVDNDLGEAGPNGSPAQDGAAIDSRGHTHRAPWVIAGVAIMSLILGIAALTMQPQAATPPASATAAARNAEQTEIARAARDWLALVDAGRWEDSYRGTADSFHAVNTLRVWTDVNERGRVPLGAVLSRADLSVDWVPAPPAGYQMVKFRTSFANRPNTVETVTLVREGGAWRVAGCWID